VFERGNIVRATTAGIARKGRNTQGVILVKPGKNDRVVAIARNPEKEEAAVVGDTDASGEDDGSGTGGVSEATAPSAPATVPGPDGVPSDETSGDEDGSSDGDNGGDA
jgi:DNA gyrase subunit A